MRFARVLVKLPFGEIRLSSLVLAAPLLGLAGTAAGGPIDGIQCDQPGRLAVHVHVHLAIYGPGGRRAVPAGIGVVDPVIDRSGGQELVVGGRCFYWLHTHTPDGVIHAEAPRSRGFTLGEFFDVWGEALTAGRVGEDVGPVTVYVDGRRWTGDPRAVPLQDRSAIQLDAGTGVAPQPYRFGSPAGPFLWIAGLAAASVLLAALAAAWTPAAIVLSTAVTFGLVAGWRAASGLLGLTGTDPLALALVDGGCAAAGAVAALAMSPMAGRAGLRRWAPGVAGAAAAAVAAAFLG